MAYIIGFVVSYIIISICESFFHRTIYHAGPRIRQFYAKSGTLGYLANRAWFQHHVIHHYLTFRENHVTQFSSISEREKLDQSLQYRGRDRIKDQIYGTRIGSRLSDFILYMGPTLPFFLIACWIGGAQFTIGGLIPLVAWPILAQYVHPYIHMDHDTLRTEAPVSIRLFSKTPYFRFLVKHHWLHHKYENCNYNLLLGGDLFWRQQRIPSEQDLRDMADMGLIKNGGI